MGGATGTWEEIGSSTTTPAKNIERKEVKIDDYYVVVGFEVNKPAAFVDDTHDLAKDYGHAFFYVVKNNVMTKVFSFGPNGRGKIGWFDQGQQGGVQVGSKFNQGALIKDGYKNSRPGTPDYAISEEVKVFKILLTVSQGKKLEAETDKMREKIVKGKQNYTAYLNDTCAETARDVLRSAGVDTPSGSGKVKHSGVLNFPIAYAVNPYMWHHNFKLSKSTEVSGIFDNKDPAQLVGQLDPFFTATP
jgi:hypothetical protein